MKAWCILLCCWLTTAVSALATNYYVDALHGNDKASGTKASQAWKTLSKASQAPLLPGDSLLFRRGCQWNGSLKITAKGSPDRLVCITAYGQGQYPRFNANGSEEATVHLLNCSYLRFSRFELTNTGTERSPGRSGLFIQALDAGTLPDIAVSDLYIHDVNGSLVKKQGGGQGIQVKNGGKIQPSRFDGLLIERCHIVRTERNGIIFNSESWARDRWFPNLKVVVQHCLLEQVPGDGIVPLGCEGALVQYNRMRDCPRLLPDGEAAAGIWPWSCDHTLIQYNEVSDHKAPWDAQGFDCDYNCVGTVIQYNYSHDNEGGFLLVCSPSDQKYPWNIGCDSSVVRYNLSINDGFRLSGPHAGFSPTLLITGPVSNTQIYGNTIVVPAKPKGADINLVKMDTWGGRWPINTTLRENIWQVADSATISQGKDENTRLENEVYFGRVKRLPSQK